MNQQSYELLYLRALLREMSTLAKGELKNIPTDKVLVFHSGLVDMNSNYKIVFIITINRELKVIKSYFQQIPNTSEATIFMNQSLQYVAGNKYSAHISQVNNLDVLKNAVQAQFNTMTDLQVEMSDKFSDFSSLKSPFILAAKFIADNMSVVNQFLENLSPESASMFRMTSDEITLEDGSKVLRNERKFDFENGVSIIVEGFKPSDKAWTDMIPVPNYSLIREVKDDLLF